MRSAEAGSDAAYRVEPALAGPVTAGLVASRGGNQEHDGLHAVLHGLRQRIANGGDSLMRDCAPALAALEQGLAASEQLGLEHVGEDGALLRELLEFLHGYAEGMSRRDPASADFLQQIERIEARLHVIAHDPLTAGSAVAAYGPGSRAAEGGGRVSTRERSRVFAPKKSDCADDDSEATTDPSSAAAAQAAAMVVGSAGPGRVSGIDDASLDKDQRKRREESLPLVVIRSI